MSDPYNTAGPPRREALAADAARPRGRVRGRGPGRGRKHAVTKSSTLTVLLPVFNVLVLLFELIKVGVKDKVTVSSFMWIYAPLILAVISNSWMTSQVLAITTRVLNALLATFVIFKLLRYASVGVFTSNMLILFLTTAVVPILNALYLKPRSVE